MAVFSPVFGLEDHAEAAVRASLPMGEALSQFNRSGKYPMVRYGIGIHTAVLIAGNMGSENRKDPVLIRGKTRPIVLYALDYERRRILTSPGQSFSRSISSSVSVSPK